MNKNRRITVFLSLVLAVLLVWGVSACVDLAGVKGGQSSPVAGPEPAPGTAAKGAPLYWMSVSTDNFSMPGMSQQPDTGLMGKLMGKVTGGAFGPRKGLYLQLNSMPVPPDKSQAAHDIPAGMKMGASLPLLSPEKVETTPGGGEEAVPWQKEEPPRVRIKFYWGCGETIRAGQPRILDTAKMDKAAFGKSMVSRGPSRTYPPAPRKDWVYAEWPNKDSDDKIPADASLQGLQFVHGNYIPHIKFDLDAGHDFMAPVKFPVVRGGLEESIYFEWEPIPSAVGYLAVAMAHVQKTGEMIMWSSSEVFDPGYGLMDYLPGRDVVKFIKEKVIMPPSVHSCTIPKGVFAGADGAMLQFIAYGDDFWTSYPPKPENAPKDWKPDWTAHARFKSTGALMLGQTGAAGPPQTQPAQPETKPEENPSPLKKLKGLFGG